MEFRQLEAFANVARYKSFSKAADAAFLTQPTVSTHINNLESELGVRLLNRNGREITLTAQGQEFYTYATDLLNTRTKAVMSIQNLKKEMEGVLEIQTSTIPSHYFLPKALEAFHEEYPSIQFYVEQSSSRAVNENLSAQRGEIGFTGYRSSNSLHYERIFEDEVVLITPDIDKYKSYKDGEEVPAELFINDNFIIREDGSATRQEMEKILIRGEAVFKDIHVIARMSSMAVIKRSVACGLGVSIVSRHMVTRTAEAERLRYFRIQDLSKKRRFYMVYNKNICLSPAAEEFVRFAKNFAAKISPAPEI